MIIESAGKCETNTEKKQEKTYKNLSLEGESYLRQMTDLKLKSIEVSFFLKRSNISFYKRQQNGYKRNMKS